MRLAELREDRADVLLHPSGVRARLSQHGCPRPCVLEGAAVASESIGGDTHGVEEVGPRELRDEGPEQIEDDRVEPAVHELHSRSNRP
jgi:hypothetical protein